MNKICCTVYWSIIEVGLSVKFTFFDSVELTVSSPINKNVGKSCFNDENNKFSTLLSTIVTKSVGFESFISIVEFIRFVAGQILLFLVFYFL